MNKIKFILLVLLVLVSFVPASSAHAITEAECAKYYAARDNNTITPEDQTSFFPQATTIEEAVAFAQACDRLSPAKNTPSSTEDTPPPSRPTPGTNPTCSSPAECAALGLDYISTGNEKPLHETIRDIINVVLFAAGIIAVIMIIIGGIQYSTSQGDGQKTKRAKDIIMYAIIGLIVTLLAFAIVNFVLDGITSTPEQSPADDLVSITQLRDSLSSL
jgi:hypothetical protein